MTHFLTAEGTTPRQREIILDLTRQLQAEYGPGVAPFCVRFVEADHPALFATGLWDTPAPAPLLSPALALLRSTYLTRQRMLYRQMLFFRWKVGAIMRALFATFPQRPQDR